MSQELTNYEPHHTVETKEGDFYYIESKNLDAFMEDLQNSRFIKIGNDIINVFEIKRVYQSKEDVQGTSALLKKYPSAVQKDVGKRIKKFKERLSREPRKEVVLGWAERANKGENILNN